MAVKGRPGDTDKAGVQSGGNKHQAGTISCEWPWPTPGPVVCLGTADSILPRELRSGPMMGDKVPAATTGESEAWTAVPRTARDLESGQAKSQSLFLSVSLGLRPVSQLPVKLFTTWPTVLNVALQTHRRG